MPSSARARAVTERSHRSPTRPSARSSSPESSSSRRPWRPAYQQLQGAHLARGRPQVVQPRLEVGVGPHRPGSAGRAGGGPEGHGESVGHRPWIARCRGWVPGGHGSDQRGRSGGGCRAQRPGGGERAGRRRLGRRPGRGATRGRRSGPQRRGHRARLLSPTCSAPSTRWPRRQPDHHRPRTSSEHGLRWRRAPHRAGPRPGRRPRARCCARDPETTAASAGGRAPRRRRRLDARCSRGWRRIRDPLLDALFTPFPPVARSADVRAPRGCRHPRLRPARRAAGTPVGEESFSGDGRRLLLTGNAMHATCRRTRAGSGVFGWLLRHARPGRRLPGARGRCRSARRRRCVVAREPAGCRCAPGCAVDRGDHRGRPGDRRTAGRRHAACTRRARGARRRRRARALPRLWSGCDRLPARLRRDLERFQWDNATIKVNWALDDPVPWTAEAARGAGTVHLGVDVDGFVDFAADLSVRPDARAAVPAVRPDDHLRPDPVAGRDRVGLGLHPRAARDVDGPRTGSPST